MTRSLSRIVTTAFALCVVSTAVPNVTVPAHARGQGDALSFADSRWSYTGDSVVVERFDGRETLRIQSGFAYRRDVALRDGTIDVDVMTTRRRSFVYVAFRMQTDSDYEEVYLRPHKSSLPDALQYAPVYQGQSAWQLYHGAGGTAAPEIPPGEWVRLRIVVQERQAAIFVGDTIKPALIVPRLGHDPRAGYIALRGFLPGGVPGTGPIVRYANLRVRPDYIPFTFPAVSQPTVEGVIRRWSVSDAFAAPDTALSVVPRTATARRPVEALPNGLVELHRLIRVPAGMLDVGTVARLTLAANTAGVYRMELGFSDRVTVILNGRPLFNRDDSYSFANRRDGLIGFNQATLFLPLRAGNNELELIITDGFGGWGLMGRLLDTTGVRVVAPAPS